MQKKKSQHQIETADLNWAVHFEPICVQSTKKNNTLSDKDEGKRQWGNRCARAHRVPGWFSHRGSADGRRRRRLHHAVKDGTAAGLSGGQGVPYPPLGSLAKAVLAPAGQEANFGGKLWGAMVAPNSRGGGGQARYAGVPFSRAQEHHASSAAYATCASDRGRASQSLHCSTWDGGRGGPGRRWGERVRQSLSTPVIASSRDNLPKSSLAMPEIQFIGVADDHQGAVIRTLANTCWDLSSGLPSQSSDAAESPLPVCA